MQVNTLTAKEREREQKQQNAFKTMKCYLELFASTFVSSIIYISTLSPSLIVDIRLCLFFYLFI